MMGCIQNGIPQEKALSNPSEETSPIRLEVDYDSELSSRLFKAKGSIVLFGNRSLPYLLLNATLLKDGRPLCSTKYMMIEVMPGRDSSFEISKNMRLWSGKYSCTLDVLGPEGQMASETRQCRMVEPFFAEPQPILKSHPVQEEHPSAEEEVPSVSSGRYEKSEKSSERVEENGAIPSNTEPSADEDLDEGLSRKDHGSEEASEDQEIEASDAGSKASLEGMLVGSTTSNKYHLPDCRYAAKIRPENKAYFANEEEAKRQGYLPCKSCNP